jgi:hypothetical protein
MKSADISKFDIDWQVFRVRLKKQPTYINKAADASEYLIAHLNRADRERVLNYLDGLALAYKGEERQYIVDIREDLSQLEVSDDNPCSVDFKKYDKKTLLTVARDLMARTGKWLKKGYRHEAQIAFLKDLLDYIGATNIRDELDELIAYSKTIPNTHKFLY